MEGSILEMLKKYGPNVIDVSAMSALDQLKLFVEVQEQAIKDDNMDITLLWIKELGIKINMKICVNEHQLFLTRETPRRSEYLEPTWLS